MLAFVNTASKSAWNCTWMHSNHLNVINIAWQMTSVKSMIRWIHCKHISCLHKTEQWAIQFSIWGRGIPVWCVRLYQNKPCHLTTSILNWAVVPPTWRMVSMLKHMQLNSNGQWQKSKNLTSWLTYLWWWTHIGNCNEIKLKTIASWKR